MSCACSQLLPVVSTLPLVSQGPPSFLLIGCRSITPSIVSYPDYQAGILEVWVVGVAVTQVLGVDVCSPPREGGCGKSTPRDLEAFHTGLSVIHYPWAETLTGGLEVLRVGSCPLCRLPTGAKICWLSWPKGRLTGA